MHPPKKQLASIKPSAVDPTNPMYMRVARGRAFNISSLKPRYDREMGQLTRKASEYEQSAQLLSRNPSAAGTQHIHRQRATAVRNRIQQLEAAKITYIRQGGNWQTLYPPRTAANAWMFV